MRKDQDLEILTLVLSLVNIGGNSLVIYFIPKKNDLMKQ